MNKVEVNPDHILILIETLVEEVNDHLQDEQGDGDMRDINAVREKIYAALGTTPENHRHSRIGTADEDFTIWGLDKDRERMTALYSNYNPNKGVSQKWFVYNEETFEWEETNGRV